MSGGGRETGGAGARGMGDPGFGSAEVHSGMHSGAGAGDAAYSGLGFANQETAGGVGDAGRGAGGEENLTGRVRHAAGDLGHRATDAASAAAERMSGLRSRANRVLEKRGVVDRLRENPLPVLGIAFAIGFLVAGNDDRHRDSRGARARRELRGALMAGLSTGIAQGIRSFLSETGSEGSGFVNSLLDNMMGEGSEGGASGSRGGAYGGGTGGGPAFGRSGSRTPSHRETA